MVRESTEEVIQPFVSNRLTGLLSRQEVRYLIAGAWNTVFGYGVYAGLLYLFRPWVHYMVIALVGNVLAITMAYVTHKLFVFRTTGNVLREYVRFYGVYGVTAVLGLVALPFCVEVLGMSPYVAPLLILGGTVLMSYLAHSHFSFR
jgi:putative flippase GtrA